MAEPKKLQKPARDEEDLRKEELVTYADEAGGEIVTLPCGGPGQDTCGPTLPF